MLGPGCTLPPQKYKFLISFEKLAWRKKAANLLLADYMEDEELTSFTALDGEPFYAKG